MDSFGGIIYNKNKTLKDLTRSRPGLFVRFIRYNKGKKHKDNHMTDGRIDKYSSSLYLLAIRDNMIIKHGLYGAMVRCGYGIHREQSMRQMVKNYNRFSDYYCD